MFIIQGKSQKLVAGKKQKKSKKSSTPRRKRFNQKQRIQSAKHWILTYDGSNIVKGYRSHYGVDWLCSIKELEILGVEIDPDYKRRLKTTVENQALAKKKKNTKQEELSEWSGDFTEQDDSFAYIAGYTSSGFPYGITWEEYDSLPDSEKFLAEDVDLHLSENKSINSYKGTMNNQEDKLFQLIIKANEMGADELEIEYNDGYEEVIASKDGMGYGIDRLKSNTDEAMSLLRRIHELKRRKRVKISGKEYKIQISVYDSFGENAYRIKFQEA